MRPEAEKPRNHRTSREAEKYKTSREAEKLGSEKYETSREAEEPPGKPRSREAEEPRSRGAAGQAEKPRSPTNDANEMNERNKDRRPLPQSRKPASAASMTDLRNQNDRCRNQNDRFSNQNRVAIPKPTERRPKDKRSDSKT